MYYQCGVVRSAAFLLPAGDCNSVAGRGNRCRIICGNLFDSDSAAGNRGFDSDCFADWDYSACNYRGFRNCAGSADWDCSVGFVGSGYSADWDSVDLGFDYKVAAGFHFGGAFN